MIDIFAATFQVIRVPVALGLIGFLPGAMLVRLIFPPYSFNRAEHFYVSTLASLCITALTAYVLAVSDSGLTPQGLLFWLIGFTLVFIIAADLRGRRQPQPAAQPRQTPDWWHNLRTLLPHTGLLGTAVLVLVAVIAFQTHSAPAGPQITEFYLANENYTASSILYTRRDNTIVLPVEIANHENRTVTYNIEAGLDEQSFSLAPHPTLNEGERWRSELVIPLLSNAAVKRLDLRLYEDSGAAKRIQRRDQRQNG